MPIREGGLDRVEPARCEGHVLTIAHCFVYFDACFSRGLSAVTTVYNHELSALCSKNKTQQSNKPAIAI